MTAKVYLASLLFAGLLCAQKPDPRDLLVAAQKAQQSGDLPLAERMYEKLEAVSPSAEGYQRLGLVRHLQNRFSAAAGAFDKALRLNPNLWTAHLFLGIDNYRMNRFPEALANLQAADRLQVGQMETIFWLGATHLALHHDWDGFEYLESVLEKDPNNADALRLLAETYADRGTQFMNRVAEQYPESAAGLQVQGRAFEFEGSFDAALKCYRQAAAKELNRPGLEEAITRLTNRAP